MVAVVIMKLAREAMGLPRTVMGETGTSLGATRTPSRHLDRGLQGPMHLTMETPTLRVVPVDMDTGVVGMPTQLVTTSWVRPWERAHLARSS